MAKFSINIQEGKLEKESNLIIGIDLGTTNSLVAYIKDDAPSVVRDKNKKNALVPSVIHFTNEQKVVVGKQAKEKLISDPTNTIYSVKRLMGKSYGDLKEIEEYLGYHIIDEDTESLVKIRVKDKYFTPIELSAEILKDLKNRIEEELQAKVRKAVITVPAYFNDAQRQATRDAGKLAGLDVLRIVNEPTAASLAYGIGLSKAENADGQTIAVYDLGGGTFDISILQIEEGVFEVLSTHGDTFLGGDDFDRVIIDHWVEELGFSKEELRSNKSQNQKIRILAERAKKALSCKVAFEGFLDNAAVQLTRSTFEKLIESLVEKTISNCKAALKDAKLDIRDIDHVVMVGGSTRVPLVKEKISQFFDTKVYDELDPDEVVALGAAIQADVLAGNQKDVLLLDVTPLSLGIETVGGLMDVIIPRNNKVPTKMGRQYTTSVDGQKNLKIAVYQGERDLVSDNRKLGEFILKGIPPMPAGLPKIEIHFILNADGILTVKASELRSKVEQEIEIRSQYGISEEEMANMLMESITHAADDMKVRGLLEAINEANNLLLSADKFVEQNTLILEDHEIKKIEELTTALKKSIEGKDKDRINQAIEILNSFTNPLAHRAMDINIAQAIRGKKIGENE